LIQPLPSMAAAFDANRKRGFRLAH